MLYVTHDACELYGCHLLFVASFFGGGGDIYSNGDHIFWTKNGDTYLVL